MFVFIVACGDEVHQEAGEKTVAAQPAAKSDAPSGEGAHFVLNWVKEKFQSKLIADFLSKIILLFCQTGRIPPTVIVTD
jgi:hypothetical protein